MAPPPKSSKKEKPLTVPEEKPKPDIKSPKPVNELDEIFEAKKSKKRKEKPSEETEKGEPEKKVKNEDKIKQGNKKKKKEHKNGSGRGLDEGPEAKARRRRTNDGMAIYSAEELGFGNSNAGGTALCPFDCECCF